MKKSSAPNLLWWVAIIVAVLGIFMYEGQIQLFGLPSFWVEFFAFILMTIVPFTK